MNASLQPLLDQAFHRAAANQANAAIAEAREHAGGQEPFSYEVLVKGDSSLGELAGQVLPRLVYHLESRGAHLPGCEGVFLSLFVGDSLHFIHARDAMPLFAQAVNLSFEQLSERYGTGELRRALRPGETPPEPRREPGPPPLLPGRPDEG